MTTYDLHGLRVRSEVPLAGFALDGGPADLDVRWGPPAPVTGDQPPGRVVAARRVDGRYWYVACEDGGATTLRVPGMCDFVLDERLQAVECRPDPATPDEVVGLLLAGLVVAFVLGLRGHAVLHASAVEIGGSVVALAGESGRGKSTLAAVLCAAGARLVTDDVLRLGTDQAGTVVCVGGAPQVRLRDGGTWAMAGFSPVPPASPTVDERLAVEPPPYVGPPLPLSAIALVQPSRSASAVALEPLVGAATLLRLAGATRVSGWKDAAALRRQFDVLAEVARTVRVVEAIVPWGPPLDPGVAPALFELAGMSSRR